MLKKVAHTSEFGKLDTNWNGPYVIDEITFTNAYFSQTMESERLALP